MYAVQKREEIKILQKKTKKHYFNMCVIVKNERMWQEFNTSLHYVLAII